MVLAVATAMVEMVKGHILDRPSKSSRVLEKQRQSKKLQDSKLPMDGDVQYIPPRDWKAHQPLKKGTKGFLDDYGNEWVKGDLRFHKGKHHPDVMQEGNFEWDVQLSKAGRHKFRDHLKDKNQTHLNVSWKGKVTHKLPKKG